MTTVTFTSAGSSTWTCPAGVTSVLAECWGGGGGGGGSNHVDNTYGGGGAGGEYASATVTVTPGNVYNYTVGAAGTVGSGASSPGTAGGAGGSSAFTGDTVTVTGHGGGGGAGGATGAAGSAGTGSSNTTHHNGGAGGATSGTSGGGGGGGSSGGTSAAGNAGSTGTGVTAGGAGASAVTGGGPGGHGGNSTGPSAGGAPSSGPGGGGGGAGGTSSVNENGGLGFAGQVQLTYTAVTSHPGAAALGGSGSLTAGALVTQPAAAALSGSGSVTPAAATSVIASAALIGTGFLTAGAAVSAPGAGSAALSGSGTLAVSRQAAYRQSAPLSGTGTLTAGYTGLMLQSVPLSGTGTLTVTPAAALRFTAGLFGAGFLSIPQVAGGLVAGVGGAGTPQALPGSSQVAVAPPGSSNWQWLGTLGQVTALTYSFVCPGGADKMTCTILVPASYQSQFFYPGWQVKIVRGGMDVWHGKLDQPSYQPGQGWTLTAVGNGNRGQDFNAYYTSAWHANQPDEVISQAIARGLPWLSPGYNGASFASQFWLGQSVDAGSQKVTDFLNMITSRGGLTWYVNSAPGGLYGGDDLQIFPLPTVPTRLLVATTPVPRTLGGYTNYLLIRYQSGSDNATTGTTATYAYTTATNPRSIAAHGQIEEEFDLSDAPVMSAGQAQNVGNLVLQQFVAASYGGPFTVSYGQLLNMGGQAVDLGCEGAGGMVKLLLADSAYGGSVDLSVPVTFIVGSFSYNDVTQTAQVSPFATVDQSLSGLLGAAHTALMPVAVASA